MEIPGGAIAGTRIGLAFADITRHAVRDELDAATGTVDFDRTLAACGAAAAGSAAPQIAE